MSGSFPFQCSRTEKASYDIGKILSLTVARGVRKNSFRYDLIRGREEKPSLGAFSPFSDLVEGSTPREKEER